MPIPFFYQSRSNVDVNDDDSDVFFDTMNVIVMENRKEYERFPFSAIHGNSDVGETDVFFDSLPLPQENRREYERFPFSVIQGEVATAAGSDDQVFTDTFSPWPQENRKEYERFPGTYIDSNVEFADTDSFTDLSALAVLARDDFFARPAQFLDGNAEQETSADSDTFADTFNALPQENRHEYEQFPVASLEGNVGTGDEIVDSDVFSDLFQLDISVRSDSHLWRTTGIDGNPEFADTDLFTFGFDLPPQTRHEPFVSSTITFGATVSDAALADSDVFTSTFALPPDRKVDPFVWPTSFAGPNAFEDDASYYVFSDLANAIPQEHRRDYHAWQFVAWNDPTTDDASLYVFSSTFDLPQKNRNDDFMRPFSTSHDTTEDDASFYVFTDTSQLPAENRHEYTVWPTTAAGPNTSEDDAAYTIFADTFNALPQENRHEYFVDPFGAAHDTNEDDPSQFVFARWITELPQENRHDYFAWPCSSQGDATETDSALVFARTFDLPQENRRDEFMRPMSAAADSSEDTTFNQPFYVEQLPQQNRRDVMPESLMWGNEVGTTDFVSGDAEFSDPRQLPQQNRDERFLWPISSGGDFSDRETGDVFFASFDLPTSVRSSLHEWPWSAITDDIIVGIVVAGRVEALDAFAKWCFVMDCYANWLDAADAFAGGIEAQDAL